MSNSVVKSLSWVDVGLNSDYWKEELLAAARFYLNPGYVYGISKQELLRVLQEVDGFTKEEAMWAAENVNADWYEQARDAASWYVGPDYPLGISQNEVFRILQEVDGFTKEEAAWATDNVYADWYEQALKAANYYLDPENKFDLSKQDLIDLLEWDGFLPDEIDYAISQLY